ncbi:uncharacterized protein LOC116987004 [Amblyraja radiata]|uniref:uncharacterized protein LOC116987004 n=1 Tax=Amblyraja radiata TaxID=386614 RepID=UPI0014025C54|nr:uncharacterized protein LOC116987004 [Amblyraja radiata]
MDKTMWIPIFLISALPGAVWGETHVTGVVGRAITTDCHYATEYRSRTKYWCRVQTSECTDMVQTNGQHGRSGRVSITDNPARGIFTVTVEDLHSGDTGWYICGITTPGEPTFKVHLQVSEEPVSVPVLRFLSPANVSCRGGSVTVSCESVRGSLPINNSWYENTPSVDSKISDNNTLDLHCQSFKHQHHRYYCTASNQRGSKSSEMVNVSISSSDVPCSFLVTINDTVSGAMWGERYVRGVVGRAITIDCHYEEYYRSDTKYWCNGWTIHCKVLVDTNGQHGWSGRMSITDNPSRGIFTVTVEDLQSGESGWYKCGIDQDGTDPFFNVHLQVSDEPVSAPVLRYLSPANASRLGGSVSVSCESVRGSLPIHYTWSEKNEHWVSTILSGNQLDLSCEILGGQHRQYYCTASNNRGSKPSEIVNVKVFKGAGTCSYVTEMNNAVSGALWAESEIRGVVGRVITIDCHYAAVYRSHTKYWCPGTRRQCTHLGETNGKHGQSGRVSITDNPARGIFTVTVEDLRSGDTGWYRCGITAPGELTFKVHLQVSEEPVSAPVLRYLSPANASRLGGSVSVSCESVRGSLPINYTWFEKNEDGSLTILSGNQLDLSCEILGGQHRQYYCTASNNHGTKSSGSLKVKIFKGEGTCSYVTEMNNAEPVSVPVLAFLSPANVSSLVGSVTVSCESVRGSLPISYIWYEKTPSGDSKISDNNALDLHCQSFKHQHHQYYCTASNDNGTKSSEMVNMCISSTDVPCSFVVKINGSVSGAMWGERNVRGVVGRAITIDCHYEEYYRSDTKYWCNGWTIHCKVLVDTNGQHGRSGRMSITDNPSRGIFTVTVEDLQSGESGWYKCGIDQVGTDPFFNVHLQVSDEPVSAPVLRYLSPANASRLGGSVSVSCESVRGSLPIHYTWSEKNEHWVSTILSGNQLDLSCEILGGQHRQYYCTASNNRGSKPSEIVNVKVFKGAGTCSYVTEMNNAVSGALWAESEIRGVVGRAVTIDCHYAAVYRSHTKYWCPGTRRQCTHLGETNGKHGQSGRVSITDNPARGIFTVTVEDLRSGDTGWYRCGITAPGELTFKVHLQVSEEPVSAPVLRYLSPANASRLGGSVSVSCESVSGSLPIHYKWFENNVYVWSTILSGNQLDLSCEILRGQHRQYYCTAANNHGTKSSEILNVKVFKGAGTCSYVTEINNTVSGALWAESEVRGIVGRAITIDCHYAAVYRSHTKYWCPGTSRQWTHVGETNGKHGQSGRVSITDNPARGIFTVTVEDLHSGDTGWYRCGITTPGELTFKVHLQVSEEPVSAPVLRYLSPANASRLGGSVSVACESVRGTLPINYTWFEKNEEGSLTILSGNQLDLSCEILGGQHRQYYCTASNNRGTKPSGSLKVKVFKGAGKCSYVTEMNNAVSGALWAESEVRGVAGRAITIDCHYAAVYRSHTKYWCNGTSRQCTHVVETNGKHGQSGKVSITDNPERGIFTVTVEDLHSGDTGWYRCGITIPGEPTFKVHLQVSEEPVSVPVLGFLSPANVSCLGGAVSVSCESVRGSLPISYIWYEMTPSGDSKISDNNALDLHCQSFKHQHHQYYCTASNDNGTKSSEMVNMSISSSDVPCSFLVKINGTVTNAMWGEKRVRGVVGRAITIDCHYAAEYRSHTKYWCNGWCSQSTVLVKTNGQHGRRGRVSITDNSAQGIFTVTVEDLHSGDTGWYSCGITTSAGLRMVPVHLQVSDEPMSAPVLSYLSPANASRLGGSVSVSCESVRGSLPIHYTWCENEDGCSTTLSGNQLDLSCEILRGQHRQYYCRASNNRVIKYSENLHVKVFKGAGTCSYVTEMNNAVSGALWAESEIRGVVGRAITIDCHYAAVYRSHTKYWCRETTRQCTHVVETNGEHGQSGRVSITDNTELGIFTLTVENLHSGYTGWYRCGITTPGEPTFKVHLQVSEEPVSVPVLGFLSPANVSCLGGSVTVSCESVRGSLPISYSWYEKTPSGDSKISDNNTLDLHCQSFKHQHHQYYCTASNKLGSKSSEMVNVSISSSDVPCSFLVEINGTGLEYSCQTSKRSKYTSRINYIVVSGVTVLLLILIIAFFWYRKRKTEESKYNTSHGEDNNETQEMAVLEGDHVDAKLQQLGNNRAGDHLDNNEDEITYAVVKCQRKTRSRQHVAENAVVYADVNFHRNCPKGIRKPHSPGTPENPESIYASVVS